MKRGIVIVLVILLLGVFGYAAFQAISIQSERSTGHQVYDSLAEQFTVVEQNVAEPVISVVPENTILRVNVPISVDFDALMAENPDFVGWLYSEGTVLNFPIVQGTDNSYYLKHLPDGTDSFYGTIFVDCNNLSGFADGNTIIYGHNMNDGMIFAELTKYAQQSYYDAHPVLWLLTPEQTYQVRLFSSYLTKDAAPDTYQIFPESDERLLEYAMQRVEKSDFQSKFTPKIKDKIVTFSTCEYSGGKDSRYVVHGILQPVEKLMGSQKKGDEESR